MRIWDAELLTAKKDVELVTDGLIMWIDGRDAPLISSANSQKIYERVTGSYLSNNSTSPILAQSSDGLFLEFLFSGSVYNSYPFSAVSSLTLETVISPETLYGYVSGYGGRDVMYVSRDYTDPPYIRTTYKKYDQSANIYFYPSAFPQHLVYRPHSIMCNGEKEVVQETIETRITNAVHNNSWSPHLKKIGAIRAYNRELTDDEVLQNLEYEKSIGRVVL